MVKLSPVSRPLRAAARLSRYREDEIRQTVFKPVIHHQAHIGAELGALPSAAIDQGILIDGVVDSLRTACLARPKVMIETKDLDQVL